MHCTRLWTKKIWRILEVCIEFSQGYSSIRKKTSLVFHHDSTLKARDPKYQFLSLYLEYNGWRTPAWDHPRNRLSHLVNCYIRSQHCRIVFPWRTSPSRFHPLDEFSSGWRTTIDDCFGQPSLSYLLDVGIFYLSGMGEMVMAVVSGWFWSLLNLSLRRSVSVTLTWILLKVSIFWLSSSINRGFYGFIAVLTYSFCVFINSWIVLLILALIVWNWASKASVVLFMSVKVLW